MAISGPNYPLRLLSLYSHLYLLYYISHLSFQMGYISYHRQSRWYERSEPLKAVEKPGSHLKVAVLRTSLADPGAYPRLLGAGCTRGRHFHPCRPLRHSTLWPRSGSQQSFSCVLGTFGRFGWRFCPL